MMNMRRTGLLAACILLLAPSVKAVAAEGLQAGPALFYPALSVNGTHDDNITKASDNAESAWITSVAPSLRVALPVRRFYINAEAGLDFLHYGYDVDPVSATDWFLGAAVGADFPGGLSFKVADRYETRYLTQTQEYGAGEDYKQNDLTGTLSFAIRNSLRLEFAGGLASKDFEESARRDRAETSVSASAFWRFRPTISGLVEASYASFAYDSNTTQDNSAIQVALGLTWDVTAKSTGFAKAGLQWKSYDTENPALGIEDGSYFTVSGGLKHSFTPRTVLVIDLSRASQESDFSGNPYYLRTAVGAKLSQRLTSKLSAKIGLQYGNDDYPNATTYDNPADTVASHTGSRTDATIGGGISLDFEALRWLSIELAYGIERRSSDFDTFDYDANRVSLGATAAF